MGRIGRYFRQLSVIAVLVMLVCVSTWLSRSDKASALKDLSSSHLAYLRFVTNQMNKAKGSKVNDCIRHSPVSGSRRNGLGPERKSMRTLKANRADPRHHLSEKIAMEDSFKNNIDTSLAKRTAELFFKQRIGLVLQNLDMRHINRLSSSQSANLVQYMGVTNLNENSTPHFLRCSGLAIISKNMNEKLDIPKHYQTCKKMSFQEHGEVVGLISFPGSGNSWVRQLLETSTGVYTGSIYCDHAYVEAGMIGEGVRSGNVIAVKSHSCENTFQYTKLIYIVRNPLDAIFANFNRKVMKHYQNSPSSHVAEISDSHFGKNYMYCFTNLIISFSSSNIQNSSVGRHIFIFS